MSLQARAFLNIQSVEDYIYIYIPAVTSEPTDRLFSEVSLLNFIVIGYIKSLYAYFDF